MIYFKKRWHFLDKGKRISYLVKEHSRQKAFLMPLRKEHAQSVKGRGRRTDWLEVTEHRGRR